MNRPSFDTLVDQILASIFASPMHRQAMREELLSHLHASYQEELSRPGTTPDSAHQSAQRRLGPPADLRNQYQASVHPLERLIYQYLLRKDHPMSRWLWFLAVFAFFFGPGIILPALARHKQQGVPWLDVAIPLILGIFITLAAIGILIYGIFSHRRRVA